MEWRRTYSGVIWKDIGVSMLVHEFVLANSNEISNSVSYNLTKTAPCVKIADSVIVNNHDFLSSFKTYWWHMGNVHSGLNYYGITIIPNESLKQFIDILMKNDNRNDIRQLLDLCMTAVMQNKNIVHFGI